LSVDFVSAVSSKRRRRCRAACLRQSPKSTAGSLRSVARKPTTTTLSGAESTTALSSAESTSATCVKKKETRAVWGRGEEWCTAETRTYRKLMRRQVERVRQKPMPTVVHQHLGEGATHDAIRCVQQFCASRAGNSPKAEPDGDAAPNAGAPPSADAAPNAGAPPSAHAAPNAGAPPSADGAPKAGAVEPAMHTHTRA